MTASSWCTALVRNLFWEGDVDEDAHISLFTFRAPGGRASCMPAGAAASQSHGKSASGRSAASRQ